MPTVRPEVPSRRPLLVLRLEDRLTPTAGNLTGGATVAAGDLTGDGYTDAVVCVAGNGPPTVGVIDGRTGAVAWEFLAYSTDFTGGVSVAVGDVTGDGRPDIVTGAGAGGGPNVKVFDGVTHQEVRSFYAFAPGFTGGARVAVGDVTGDGRADIAVAAGSGGGPVVAVFDGATGSPLATVANGDPAATVGATVAMGDLTGDGRADLVVGSGGGVPVVRVYDLTHGTDPVGQFPPYDAGFSGPVWVAVGDVTGDGRPDVVTGAGAGGGPNVRLFDGPTFTLVQSWLAYPPPFRGGVLVSTADFNGDGRAEVLTGAGVGGGPNVRLFDGNSAALLNSIACDGQPAPPLATLPAPPTVSLTAPITGTVTDNGAGVVAVEVSVNDGAFTPVTVQDDGSFGLSPTDLQPGLNTVAYRATDKNGNRSTPAVHTVFYQPAPPPVAAGA